MGVLTKWACRVSLVLLVLFASCSGKSNSDEPDISGESIYRAGTSVKAVSFSESINIELFLDVNGTMTAVHDGDYIKPGNQKVAVKVKSDPSTIDRVYVTDGGIYQVQAILQDDVYECEFNIGEGNIYQVILIQVIHSSGRANKEKIVVRTSRSNAGTEYIKNGMGLLVAQEILDGQNETLAEILDVKIRQVFNYTLQKSGSLVTQLQYGDNNASTRDIIITSLEVADSEQYPEAALHVSFIIKNVSLKALPLFSQTLIETQGNDLAADVYLSFKDTGDGEGPRLILDFLGSARVAFATPFFLERIVEDLIASDMEKCNLPPAAFDLAQSVNPLSSFLSSPFNINGSDVRLSSLVSELDLRKYLFVDLYGLTGGVAQGHLALGFGFSLDGYDDIQWETVPEAMPQDQTNAEEIVNVMFKTTIDAAFESIRQKYQGLVTELSYGDNDPGTDDFVINGLTLLSSGALNTRAARVNFTVKQVDLNAVNLFAIPLIHTTDNDLTIDAVFNIEYPETGAQIFISTESVSDVKFSKIFIGDIVVEGLIKQDLLDMDDEPFQVEEILSGITLGINLAEALSSQERYPAFPEKVPVYQSPGWKLDLPDPYTISCAISQHAINRLFSNFLDGMTEWDTKDLIIPILGNDFPGFNIARSPSEETIVRLSVPPVLDLSSSVIHILLPDVILQYRVSGIPQWEASVDLDLIVTPSVAGKKLNLFVTPAEGQNHFHIMKDNRGNLGIFDHSPLVETIVKRLPAMLGGAPEDPAVSIDFTAWEPTIIFYNVSTPLRVASGDGYLYIYMAASSLDLEDYIGSLTK